MSKRSIALCDNIVPTEYSKKALYSICESQPSRICAEDIITVKNIIIRNDNYPYVLTNVNSAYVKIGNYIYQVKEFDDSWKINQDMTFGGDTKQENIDKLNSLLALTISQYNDVSNFIIANKVNVRSYNDRALTIDTLTVSLTTLSNFVITTKLKKISQYIIHLLKNHIVSREQNISIKYSGIIIGMNIDDIDSMTIGKICEKTQIEFRNVDSNIIIYDKCIEIDCNQVNIYVTKCIDQSKSTMFPLIVDQSVLNRYAKRAFINKFADNDTRTYVNKNIEYTFNVHIINPIPVKHKNMYLLEKKGALLISSDIDDLIITNGNIIADSICFTVDGTTSKYTNSEYIVSIDDVMDFVTRSIKVLTDKQVFECPIKTKTIRLHADNIDPQSNDDVMYKIDSNTAITFDTNPNSRFIIVLNKNPYDIVRASIKVKKVTASSSKNKSISAMIDNDKFAKHVYKLLPKRTACGHRIKITYNRNDYILTVKDIQFEDDISMSSSIYRLSGRFTKKTVFSFTMAKNNSVTIISRSVTINLDSDSSSESSNSTPSNSKSPVNDPLFNPIVELEKYVGGISNELKKVVRNICLSRGKLRDEFNLRGLKTTKGIIFYGPPGTGKTTLARNLGKIIGCTNDQFRLMAGPEIFVKWVGDSEANVRAIFKPAKEAWKKDGDNATTYMVVIDEIDAMLPSRSGLDGSPVRDSVVNQFLAEMDGLEQFNNIIIVGITNRLELLDPAAIRPGRFGVHIKIDLPDKDGRVAIFNIHTKKLRDCDRMIEFNIDELADLTNEFSGADIENVVETASMLSLERLNDDDLTKSAIIEHGKVTFDDFITAIKEIKEFNKKSTCNDIIPNMYL